MHVHARVGKYQSPNMSACVCALVCVWGVRLLTQAVVLSHHTASQPTMSPHSCPVLQDDQGIYQFSRSCMSTAQELQCLQVSTAPEPYPAYTQCTTCTLPSAGVHRLRPLYIEDPLTPSCVPPVPMLTPVPVPVLTPVPVPALRT